LPDKVIKLDSLHRNEITFEVEPCVDDFLVNEVIASNYDDEAFYI